MGAVVRLCRYTIEGQDEGKLGLVVDDHVVDVGGSGGPRTLADAMRLSNGDLAAALEAASASNGSRSVMSDATVLAPIDEQEVWAAGVTYLRSRNARMEESTQKDVYDQVYEADRPEIFFKATPNRVSGPGAPVAIRQDSGWNVPEPELVLLLNTRGEIAGYTIGNDVSSRSIEGENPLYLPQAKLYHRSAALGPLIVTGGELEDVSNLAITLTIRRSHEVLFHDVTSTSQLHRTLEDLSSYLFRANQFPAGVFLMTGTGIVPPAEFTLEAGDEVTIAIEGIGSLFNPVVRTSS